MRPGGLFFKVRPYAHQLKEYMDHRTSKSRALLWSMRTGKSKVVIDQAAFNWHVEEITAVLIFAPNIAHQNWLLQEFPTHCPDNVPWEGLIWNANRARTKNKAFMAQFQRVCLGRDKLMVLSVNSESLASKVCRAFLKTFLKYHKGRIFFIADESHQYGAPGSKRTGAGKAARDSAKFKRILSGTSIDNSPMQAYSQFNLLEEAALGFSTIDDFKNYFGVWKSTKTREGRPYQKFLGPQREDELRERMSKYASVVTREDAGLLRPIDTQRRFELTDIQRKAWKALKANPIMGGKPLDGGPLMMKLQQISSGFLIDENRVTHELVKPADNPRFILTMHEAMNSEGKVVIWCRFRYDIIKLSEMFAAQDILFLQMFGDVPQKQKFENLEQLRDDPAVKGIIGQPQSGGAGVDMRAADTLIWCSHTSDLILRNQASDRASAIGKKAVDLIDIVGHNTNDDFMLDCLSDKEDVSDRISRTGLQELLQRIGDG